MGQNVTAMVWPKLQWSGDMSSSFSSEFWVDDQSIHFGSECCNGKTLQDQSVTIGYITELKCHSRLLVGWISRGVEVSRGRLVSGRFIKKPASDPVLHCWLGSLTYTTTSKVQYGKLVNNPIIFLTHKIVYFKRIGIYPPRPLTGTGVRNNLSQTVHSILY
jgi:hypothetical protein